VLKVTNKSKPSWCFYCYSETPERRGLVHKPHCLKEQAWDIEEAFCDCGKAYRCRGNFHKRAHEKGGRG